MVAEQAGTEQGTKKLDGDARQIEKRKEIHAAT